MDSRNVNINNGNFASFSMNNMQGSRTGPQYDPRGPPHDSYPSPHHSGPSNPPPRHPPSRQHPNSGGSSYYNHVDNSVHDNSSVQYGNTYSNTTHNTNGVARIGSVGNANFGTNYGSINQSSNDASYGALPPPSAPPHHHRGSGNPFLQQGQWPNSGYDSYAQDPGYWDHSWQNSQYGNGGSGQCIQEAEVNVRSTHVQRASSNPFRAAAPVTQGKPSVPPPNPGQPRRSASSQGESMDRDHRARAPPRASLMPAPVSTPSTRPAPSKTRQASSHRPPPPSRPPPQRRSPSATAPPVSSDEESESEESESEEEEEEPPRRSGTVRVTRFTKVYPNGRPPYIASGSTTPVVVQGPNGETGSGPDPNDPGSDSGNSDGETEVSKRMASSSSSTPKVVLRRGAPAATDTDTDVEEAKGVVMREEAERQKTRSTLAIKPADTPTSSADKGKDKEPVGPKESATATGVGKGRPVAKSPVSSRERRPAPEAFNYETSSDEEDGREGGFQWEIPDSETESGGTTPTIPVDTSEGKGREVRALENVSAARISSNKDEGPSRQVQGRMGSSGSVSSTSGHSSVPNITIESDTDFGSDSSSSRTGKAPKNKETFSDLLITKSDSFGFVSLLNKEPARMSAPSSSVPYSAPPQYTPDPSPSSTASISQSLAHAQSSSSAAIPPASASGEVEDTPGDLQVEGKLKRKKGLMRGLKSVFKDSKGKKEKHVSFDGEGGVVGAPGVRDD